MLVVQDTILLQGFFIDTSAPFRQGFAFAKIDSSGNLISYERYYDPNGRDLTHSSLNNMIQLSDGRFLTVGITFQDNALLLIFLDSDFTVDTVFEYFANDPSVQVNFIRNVVEIEDGYLAFGNAQRHSFATDGQIFMVKRNGELAWRKWYGFHNQDESFGDVCRYTDSTFIIGSYHKPFPVQSTDKRRNTWIFEMDENGNVLQEFVDPDPFSGTSGGLNVDENQNIYFSGGSIVVDQYGQHNALGRIGMLNNKFELQWKEEFGKNLSIYTGLVEMMLSGNSLIAVGSYVDTVTIWNHGTRDPLLGFIAMVNIIGDSICQTYDTAQWYNQIGSYGMLRALDTLSSGSIVACGDGRFGPLDDYSEYAWLVKMPNPPCEGLKVSTNPESTLQKKWYINPNPSNGTLTIKFDLPSYVNLHFIMFDAQGRKVQQFKIEPGIEHFAVDIDHLSTGTYLIQSVDSRGRITGIEKLILLK